MKHYYYQIALLFSLFIGVTNAATPIVCSQEYVLCTSAPCVPDPRHPDYAICSCVVENGDSIGYKTCAQRTPQKGQFKIKRLVSTFSFKQFSTKKTMRCARGKPWASCLDAPCTVNPLSPTKAICSCKINHDQDFVTLGGGCDEQTCATGLWSGSMISSGKSLRKALLEKMGITKNPWTNNCPTTKASKE